MTKSFKIQKLYSKNVFYLVCYNHHDIATLKYDGNIRMTALIFKKVKILTKLYIAEYHQKNISFIFQFYFISFKNGNQFLELFAFSLFFQVASISIANENMGNPRDMFQLITRHKLKSSSSLYCE